MKFLKHNWNWKLLSIVLAVIVASFVYRGETIQRTTLLLPIAIAQPARQRVEEPAPGSTVRVDLEGPATIVNRLVQAEQVKLNLDTSHVRPGERTQVPIGIEIPLAYRDEVHVSWRPRAVSVLLASDLTRTLPILSNPLNELSGWEFTEPPRVDPPRVKVRGSQSALERVERVLASFLLDEKPSIARLVRLQAVDNKGTIITEDVQLDPPQAMVSAIQQRVVLQKRVPVQPVFQAPPGASVDVTVQPSRVQVTGPQTAVGNIYVIETDPFQIPAGRTTFSQEVVLVPQAERVQVSPSRVRVTVRLEHPPVKPPQPPQPAGNAPPG